MRIAFFGSSLVSAYWNGAATYYRGIIRALHARGHRITFFEPDAYDRQAHRDCPDPPWATIRLYANSASAVLTALDEAAGSDMIIKASGVGVFDDLLEEGVLCHQCRGTTVVFWDVDAPATLDRVQKNPSDPFAPLIPRYDMILTYGGGKPVAAAYQAMGARRCAAIYNAVDSQTHHPSRPRQRFSGDLGFLGNRLPDREARVEEFFLAPAQRLADRRFVLGGSGWGDKQMPCNVKYVGHVGVNDHNGFNCSALAVLNVSRDSMARYGFSPATRVFEAAGAGACLITDAWEGIEQFLEPRREVLVARSAAEVAEVLCGLWPQEAHMIGQAALRRVLHEHTYERRADEFESVFAARRASGTNCKIRAGAS